MRTYQVNYDAVAAEVRNLRNHVNSNIINTATRDYRMVQNTLHDSDGATNASYQTAMDENIRKTVSAAQVLNRLLHFIESSSRQIQTAENNIARVFRIHRH